MFEDVYPLKVLTKFNMIQYKRVQIRSIMHTAKSCEHFY